MRTPEDPLLTSRVNARETAAFLALYDNFSAAIYRHALIRTNSKEVAEDTTAHTFAKTWEYLQDPNNVIRNCKAFLFRTAHNYIVDHWRDHERERTTLDDPERSTPDPSVEADAPQTINQKMDVAWLRARLSELPAAERRLLLWRYVEELPIGEISKLSGKSMGATYVAIHRAKRLLERTVLEYRPHR